VKVEIFALIYTISFKITTRKNFAPSLQLEAEIQQNIKHLSMKPGTSAHTCNPSYSGGKDQEDHSSNEAIPGQIVLKTLS
jgi:hypothetical protein